MSTLGKLHRIVEKVVGMPIEEIQRMTVAEHRRRAEQKHGAPMRIVSCRPPIVSRREIDRELDRLLGRVPLSSRLLPFRR